MLRATAADAQRGIKQILITASDLLIDAAAEDKSGDSSSIVTERHSHLEKRCVSERRTPAPLPHNPLEVKHEKGGINKSTDASSSLWLITTDE